MRDILNFCHGCHTDPKRERNLPETWQLGDPIPEGTTSHYTPAEGRAFYFRGAAARQDRVYPA